MASDPMASEDDEPRGTLTVTAHAAAWVDEEATMQQLGMQITELMAEAGSSAIEMVQAAHAPDYTIKYRVEVAATAVIGP